MCFYCYVTKLFITFIAKNSPLIIPVNIQVSFTISFQGSADQFVFMNMPMAWDDARVFCEKTGNIQIVSAINKQNTFMQEHAMQYN